MADQSRRLTVRRFVIGDVRGKGLPSVAHAARAIRAFRFSSGSQPDLAHMARDMSHQLSAFLGEEDFITALLVETVEGHTVNLVSCGHPALLLCTDGLVEARNTEGKVPAGHRDR